MPVDTEQRIVVFGAGSIGVYIGAALRRAGDARRGAEPRQPAQQRLRGTGEGLGRLLLVDEAPRPGAARLIRTVRGGGFMLGGDAP